LQPGTEKDAFAALYARHHLHLLRFVLTLVPDRQQAEEIVQETACLLWQKFDQYDPDQPFWPWARQFAHYEVLKHRKKQAVRRRYFSDALVEQLAEERVRHEEMLETRREVLLKCLDELDGRSRRLLLDRYSREESIAEVAERMGKSANAIYLLLHRLRQALLQCVERKLQAEGGA
jgi:RNA polymerase sigma-70 factor (ECF subfamily)